MLKQRPILFIVAGALVTSLVGCGTTPSTPSARHLAAAIEIRSGDLQGWPGFNQPLQLFPQIARCMGAPDPLRPAPLAIGRSEEFGDPLLNVQSYTYVFATASQAKWAVSLYRNRRLPLCETQSVRANYSRQHIKKVTVSVESAPLGVESAASSDALTTTLTTTNQEPGAAGVEQYVSPLLVLRSGRVVTHLIMSASSTVGPFPTALFDRLSVTLSQRLMNALGVSVAST